MDKNNKTRVLYFVDRLLWGGIQSLLYDIVTHIDRNRVIIDIMTLDDGRHYELEDKLRSEGIRVRQLKGVWNHSPKDFPHYIKEVKAFFKQNAKDYDVVHMNSSCKNVWILYYAKKYGIRTLIAHSHNTDFAKTSRLSGLVMPMLTWMLKRQATDCLACSENAARWMFGDSYVKKGKVKIVRNAIDTEAFLFNPEWRNKLRNELGLDGKMVYGCVGRLEPQKNHKFLIEVFAEIKKRQRNAALLLVGSGSLESELQAQVNDLGLTDNVIFAGFKTNRNEYLSAMDVFVVTSTYEGFSIVTIEAQAAALPCFVSKGVVPPVAKISDLVTFVSLSESAKQWADRILAAPQASRMNMKDTVVKSGCDMTTMIDTLTKIYEQ